MRKRGACHDCGHAHPTMASASRGGEHRWFCHENDHSCYSDRHGRYFDDDLPRQDAEHAMWELLKPMLGKRGKNE